MLHCCSRHDYHICICNYGGVNMYGFLPELEAKPCSLNLVVVLYLWYELVLVTGSKNFFLQMHGRYCYCPSCCLSLLEVPVGFILPTVLLRKMCSTCPCSIGRAECYFWFLRHTIGGRVQGTSSFQHQRKPVLYSDSQCN